MPYQFRQSQVMAPSRKIAPELAHARELLKVQLGDMSTTGRGLSQTECYRTLVQLESLVIGGHNRDPQDLAMLARRVGAVVEESQGRLSLNDLKALRRAVRPYFQRNPLLKRDAARTHRAPKAAKAAAENGGEASAFQALPPIVPATPASEHVTGSESADTERGPRTQSRMLLFPARKPRNRDEWDAMILAKDAADLQMKAAEKAQAREKKIAYNRELQLQIGDLDARKQYRKMQVQEDKLLIQEHVAMHQRAHEEDCQKRAKKATFLRQANAEGLMQRKKILGAEEEHKAQMETILVNKAKKDQERDKALEERKRQKQNENVKNVIKLNEERKVMNARRVEQQHAEEERINREAMHLIQKREREREKYLENQQKRIAAMMALGNDAVKQTDQREKDDVARAERFAAMKEAELQATERRKREDRARQNCEVQAILDGQVEERRRLKGLARKADREYAEQFAKETAANDEKDRQKKAARRRREEETRDVVVRQIMEKHHVADGNGGYLIDGMEAAPPPGRKNSNAHERRGMRELVSAQQELETRKFSGATFQRPPPGTRPRRK